MVRRLFGLVVRVFAVMAGTIDPSGIATAAIRYPSGIRAVDGSVLTADAPVITIGVLGPLQVGANGASLGPRLRVVLAALVVRRGEVVSPDRIADALWGEEPPGSWAKQVQICVMQLRKALGPKAIETVPGGYRLALSGDDLDVCQFERLVERGRVLAAGGQAVQATSTLARALSLWRGDPFTDLDGWPPGQSEVARLEELRRGAEEDLLDARLDAGEHREVVARAQAAALDEPLRERRWAILALAEYRCGRQADALRSLMRAREVLREQLGVEPGPELAALEKAILDHDPSLAVAEAPPVTQEQCPYKGLAPYDTGDAESFFGRDADVEACLERLQVASLLVVTGPSGCGKTSLLRAGLVPALLNRGLSVTALGPDGDPRSELADLFGANEAPVVVVDQVEELMARDSTTEARRSFCERLAAYANDRGPVVLGVRADHLAGLAAEPTLARLVERGLHLVGPLAGEALRAAIEEPARRAGIVLEPGFVDLVVRDTEGEPGALPLMSHALAETWRRRDGRVLTVEGYRATGGIRGAVARSADQLYESLTADQREVLRSVLLRLVATSPDGEPVRSRVQLHAIAGDPAWQRVIGLLVRARLVTTEEDSVELAHEALARAWPRLRSWLDEDAGGQRILRHLATAAEGWESLGRPDDELYRGARLETALEWREATTPDLTSLESAFLERSAANQRGEVREAAERALRQHRTNRRLKGLLAAVALLLAVAVVAGLFAVRQRDRADEEANVAEARRVAAQALVDRRYDRALLLAVEARRLWDSAETAGNLLDTIARSPHVARVIRGSGTRLVELVVAPQRGWAAAVESEERIAVHDTSTGDELGRLGAQGIAYRSPTFSPGGDQLVASVFPATCWIGVGCERSRIEVFDAPTLRPAGVRFEGFGPMPAADISYSPRGDLVAAVPPFVFAEPSDNIVVWDVDRPGEPLVRLSLTELGVHRPASPDSLPRGWVRISADGSRLYASGAGPTVAFDLGSGEPIRTFDGEGGLALSPDGRSLAVLTSFDRVGLFDTSSGGLAVELAGHEDLVTAAAFSPDGEIVATSSNDESVAVWSARSGERLLVLQGHAGSVQRVAFGDDRSTLYTSAADGSIMVWDLSGAGGLTQQLVQPYLIGQLDNSVHISPAGDSAAVANLDDVRVIDLDSGRVTALPTLGEVIWLAYSPDGRRLAAVGFDGVVQVWDVDNGERLASELGRGSDNYGAVAFAADGSVIVADADGTVSELDGLTLEPTGRTLRVGFEPGGVFTGPGGVFAVTSFSPDAGATSTEVAIGGFDDGLVTRRVDVASAMVRADFSPDGARLAVGGFDGRLAVMDAGSGEVVGQREPVHDGPISWVTVSPDGRTVASVSTDGELALSDSSTATRLARVAPGQAKMHAAVVYEPDGRAVVLAFRDGSAVRFETAADAWVDHACRVAGRNLTEDEWRDVFGDRPYRETCPSPG